MKTGILLAAALALSVASFSAGAQTPAPPSSSPSPSPPPGPVAPAGPGPAQEHKSTDGVQQGWAMMQQGLALITASLQARIKETEAKDAEIAELKAQITAAQHATQK